MALCIHSNQRLKAIKVEMFLRYLKALIKQIDLGEDEKISWQWPTWSPNLAPLLFYVTLTSAVYVSITVNNTGYTSITLNKICQCLHATHTTTAVPLNLLAVIKVCDNLYQKSCQNALLLIDLSQKMWKEQMLEPFLVVNIVVWLNLWQADTERIEWIVWMIFSFCLYLLGYAAF